jgi:membrane-bound lytic murein transglycosylase B
MKVAHTTYPFLLPLLLSTIILLPGCASNRTHEKEIIEAVNTLPPTNLSTVEYAYQELIKNGVSTEFAKRLESQYLKEKKNSESRDQIIQLNVLGFLTPGDYSKHYSLSAVKHIKKFIKKYGKTLNKAEKEFQVPKEIIASLLWVETKHGKTMGSYHLPMVYFSLMQATHPEVAKTTLTELNFRKPSSNSSAASLSYTELQQKVVQRLGKKSQWALEQIKTLEKVSDTNVKILTIRSSFAGAFGCSQFIPSSYEKYAVSPHRDTPNLFDMKDCIFSVGNFLHQSGWNPLNPKAQSDALFEYNRIRDYGDVIQKLAASAKSS